VDFASRLALHAACHARRPGAGGDGRRDAYALFARGGACHGRSVVVVVVVVLVHHRTSSSLSEVSVVFVYGPAWTMGRPSFGSVSGDGDKSNALHCTLEERTTTN